ncbi:hydrogenase expression/formation protein HypE [Helicobacter muridarum]|uniref:Hydrogenase expression/formation protein n=1 Tax=Helicobacter muridarum TaxID=216 RepID=A0A099U0H0_9HELI|nr:hydrogenase expression/formation protein HypE [Helicobacter muridarum]TLE01174.1 hydrogenase expression/formation protein HypE [Helicobacter muridarum]STQ86050.1 hydrogenase expression/formation protein [Helicobacter muridarum]
MDIVTLAHGSGGLHSAQLTQEVFMPFFEDIMPYANEDSAIFTIHNHKDNISKESALAVTSTDSYIINPPFFAGGNIGKLSICGSSNDVAMMGAKPLFINIGFIIEEGFEIKNLKKIANSIARECKNLEMQILSADTKVLPKISQGDSQIFINTSCIGSLQKSGISARNLQHDDCIIISGKIGNHGATIFLEQNNMEISNNLQSDCASLYPLLENIFKSDINIHALRDATRGGIASTLNEWAIESSAYIEIFEEDINIDTEVLGVCEILGLDPYILANEGICLLAIPKCDANKTLEILQNNPLGKYAQIIGRVRKDFAHISSGDLDEIFFKRVAIQMKYGSKRFLEYPEGEILPRIC